MGVITIGIDPEFDVGPISLAWHGLTIALGILAGGLVAGWWLRSRTMRADPLYTLGSLLAVGGLVGGRLFYVAERDATDVLSPGALLDTRGFTFAGGVILAAILIVVYVRRSDLDRRYLDAVALGLPAGVAVGRVGDLINGEHYGEPSTWLLAVRNSHPDALTPNSALAYHSGGLYEILLALLIFSAAWPLRDRLPRTGDLTWMVLGLFAAGRFFEFFLRNDSPAGGLGLANTQWTSLALLLVVIIGYAWSRRSVPKEAPKAPHPSVR